MDKKDTIHIHPYKLNSSWHIFFVFVPSIIFVVSIVLIFTNLAGDKQQSSDDSAVSASDNLILDLKKQPVRMGDVGVIALVADTEDSRKLGLSNRDSLSSGEGMLFVFEQRDVRPPFWMKDMRFPIDIIWINDGKVIFINKDVQPEETGDDLKLYLPPEPVDYVLEVNSGFSDLHKLELGNTFTIL